MRPILLRPRLTAPGRPWRWLSALVVPALIALSLIPTALSASAQANLLTNGNFASGSTAGWTCSPADSVVTSPVYSGSSYALAGTPAGSDDAQCSQVVSVQPSSSYTLAGWVQGDYVFLGDSGTGTSDTSTWTASAPSWSELSAGFTTGASTTSVTIYLHGWYGQPTFYADNLSLTGPAGSAEAAGARSLRARRRTSRSPGRHPPRSRCPGPPRPAPSAATTWTRTAARSRTSRAPAPRSPA